jgi:phage terminase Nu1 subunit (DNA packaging protein)
MGRIVVTVTSRWPHVTAQAVTLVRDELHSATATADATDIGMNAAKQQAMDEAKKKLDELLVGKT